MFKVCLFPSFSYKIPTQCQKKCSQKEKEEFNHRSFSFPSSSKIKNQFCSIGNGNYSFFPQCWWLCICICIAMSHVQSRFVSVNGFRLMELDRFLYCMGDRVSKKVFSVHITILVCLLTLDDNFHFFDDFTDSRGFVSLFKIYL